jgi:hypothetical protein
MLTYIYQYTFGLWLLLTTLLCQGCLANNVLDKNHMLQIPLPALKADAQQTAITIIIRYKVLKVPVHEAHLVQIVLSDKILPDKITQEQEDWLNQHAIGLISHHPPAKEGTTGEVHLALPETIYKKAFLLFRMLPVHPDGKLTESTIEILDVMVE